MQEKQRLDKFLANAGFGTRKDVKKIIHHAQVLINNIVCKDPSKHITENDIVLVNGDVVQQKTQLYLMLNKPKKVVSATRDKIHQTVIDILPSELIKGFKDGQLFPVGRLDIDTEGLLLITSDGELCHKLTAPKNKIDKTYFVTLEKPLSQPEQDKAIQDFAQGIHITADRGDCAHDCQPARLHFSSPTQATLTITEGKYHQVKRMFFAIKNYVVELKRLSFANLHLDSTLEQGESRLLTSKEIELLKNP
ncbi:MAG: pseudouridine synthase [Treponemataceae bacterium]